MVYAVKSVVHREVGCEGWLPLERELAGAGPALVARPPSRRSGARTLGHTRRHGGDTGVTDGITPDRPRPPSTPPRAGEPDATIVDAWICARSGSAGQNGGVLIKARYLHMLLQFYSADRTIRTYTETRDSHDRTMLKGIAQEGTRREFDRFHPELLSRNRCLRGSNCALRWPPLNFPFA